MWELKPEMVKQLDMYNMKAWAKCDELIKLNISYIQKKYPNAFDGKYIIWKP